MKYLVLTVAFLLAGCGGGVVPRAQPAGHVPVPGGAVPANLAAVQGQPAARLIARFGQPSLDITEGNGHKLQFAGPICVLDAYLYAPKGRGEPVTVHIDTRQRDGSPIDQASCVAALSARR